MRQLPDHGPDRQAHGAVALKKKAREMFREAVVPAVSSTHEWDAAYHDPAITGSWQVKPPSQSPRSSKRPGLHLAHRKMGEPKPRRVIRVKPGAADEPTGSRFVRPQAKSKHAASHWVEAGSDKPIYARAERIERSPRSARATQAVAVPAARRSFRARFEGRVAC